MATITCNRLVAGLTAALAFGLGCNSPTPTPPPAVAAPALTREFRSTSGATAIQYYSYRSGTCGTGVRCDFDGTIRTKPGFEQAEVFLTGFTIERSTSAAALQGISASVNKVRYDGTTGDMAVRVNGTFQTGQSFSYEISFVVLLTSNAAATFTPMGNGCSDVSQCHVVVTPAGAVPAGKSYIGLATRLFFLGTNGAPMNVNALSMHLNGITGFNPGGPGSVDYLCAFRDASFAQRMFCEWSASIIAFDPAEMVSATNTPLQQLTFLNQSSIAERVHGGYQVPGGGSTQGVFDALEGVSLYYMGAQDHPIWMVDASASGFQISGVPPNAGAAEYGLFLGTTFGDKVNTTVYQYQMSRAVGFLR